MLNILKYNIDCYVKISNYLHEKQNFVDQLLDIY